VKLKDGVWGIFGDEKIVNFRRLKTSLLAALHREGWVHTTTTDADTFVFRYQSPGPVQCDWFSVTFSNNYRLWLVDAPSSVSQLVVSHLAQQKLELTCRERLQGCYEVKIQGAGWNKGAQETMLWRMLMMDTVGWLEEDGWTIYATWKQKGLQNGSDTITASVLFQFGDHVR
jgi:hypothetical protein